MREWFRVKREGGPGRKGKGEEKGRERKYFSERKAKKRKIWGGGGWETGKFLFENGSKKERGREELIKREGRGRE